MLTKTVAPKTKAELVRAIQAALFRSFDVYDGDRLATLPTARDLQRAGATVVVLKA
jgi:hypothetical protein